jgi:hypothetical protein
VGYTVMPNLVRCWMLVSLVGMSALLTCSGCGQQKGADSTQAAPPPDAGARPAEANPGKAKNLPGAITPGG